MRIFAINYKKLISFFTAIVIMCICTCDFSVNSKATDTGRTYYVYNPNTGAFSRHYTLSALPSSLNTRTVFSPDERVVDWTKIGTVKILTSSGNIHMSSGFVVDDHTIATAAHCLITDGTADVITDIRLFDTSGECVLSATPIEMHIPEYYINPIDEDNDGLLDEENYDYALITINEDLSAYCHYSLGVPTDSFLTSSSQISVTGFPGDLNNSLYVNTMYTGVGNVTGGTAKRIFHNADTAGGNSGSPIYITETRNNQTFDTVVAIHTHGYSSYNAGVRITTDLLQFYLNNNYTLL